MRAGSAGPHPVRDCPASIRRPFGAIGCDLRLPLTLTVYEDVRKDPTHFVSLRATSCRRSSR